MYNVPCSRVAHIYRKFAPFPNPGVGDFIARVRSFRLLMSWCCVFIMAYISQYFGFLSV